MKIIMLAVLLSLLLTTRLVLSGSGPVVVVAPEPTEGDVSPRNGKGTPEPTPTPTCSNPKDNNGTCKLPKKKRRSVSKPLSLPMLDASQKNEIFHIVAECAKSTQREANANAVEYVKEAVESCPDLNKDAATGSYCVKSFVASKILGCVASSKNELVVELVGECVLGVQRAMAEHPADTDRQVDATCHGVESCREHVIRATVLQCVINGSSGV